MSLLEDIFLHDEANEAQELERVIEGEEFDERPRSDSDDNSEKEDEAEEDKRRVEPNTAKTKRFIKNPRFILNPARLTGPRGIQVIPEHFKDFKFKGKGHEKEDLDLVLKKLEHWAYRLYPKFQFEDCLKKIETLGKKRPVMVHLHKIRSDQYMSEDTVVQKDSSDEDIPSVQPEEDEFDRLLQQQIELARSTPAPNSVKKKHDHSPIEKRIINAPKATSSPSINDKQRERMLRSRKLAEERRIARLKNSSKEINEESESFFKKNDESKTSSVEYNKKVNRSNVIDSSDEDINEGAVVNESIIVDIHSNNHNLLQNESNSRSNFDNRSTNDVCRSEEIQCNLDVGASKDLQLLTNVSNDINEMDSNNKDETPSDVNFDGNNVTSNKFAEEQSEILNTKDNINVNALDETNVTAENNETDLTENKDSNVDQIMDIDFSEEF